MTDKQNQPVKESFADLGAGMDFDSGPEPGALGDPAGQKPAFVAVQPVGQPVVQGGMDPLIQQENFQLGSGCGVPALVCLQRFN